MAVETGSSPSATKARGKLFAPRPTKPYIHPYLAGALLGVVLFTAFFLTGNGLGASGGLNNIIGFIEDLVAPGHIDRVPYLVKIAGGDKNPLDSWLVFMVLGTLLGGFVSGWRQRPPQGGDHPRAAYHRPHPLVHGLPGRGDHGLRRALCARLHLRAGPLRRRGALGRLVGLHVRRLRRRLRAGLFLA